MSDTVLCFSGELDRGGLVLHDNTLIQNSSAACLFFFSFFLRSVLVSICVFIALSTVFLSITSSDTSPFSRSVLLVLSLPYWSF